MSDCCAQCGQKIRKLNPHRLYDDYVSVLRALATAHANGDEWVRMWQGTTQGIDVYAGNVLASRLVWFGLAESRGHRTGQWRITDAGLRFLAGRHSVPAVIYVRDACVVRTSDERVFLKDIKDVVLEAGYWDRYAGEQVAA